MPYKPPAIQTNLNRNSSIIRKTGKNKNQPVKQFESPKNKQAVTKRKAIYKFRLLIKLSKLIQILHFCLNSTKLSSSLVQL